MDQKTMYSIMSKRGDISRFKIVIGYKNVFRNEYLYDDLSGMTKSVSDSDRSSESSDIEEDPFETLADNLQSDIDLYEFMASADQAKLWEKYFSWKLKQSVEN